jgi:3,4-dihydroxy 2-butanone 4-phosphate synthase/GTP cyclohydrolase II
VGRGTDLLAEHRRTSERVADAVNAIARREMVIVVGDRHSGFVAALVTAADSVDAEAVNFMITNGRGPLYATMDSERLDALGLEMIRPHGATPDRPAVHVPVDYRAGTTTGLSAADRATTVRALVNPLSRAADFRVPGHVFPIGARPAGVLQRPGHTEATVDLVRMAGRPPATATCSILSADGNTADIVEIEQFAARHRLTVITISDIAGYRRGREDVIERIGEAFLPLPEGRFVAIGYADRFESGEHLALVMGELQEPGPLVVRVHTECLAGDAFGSIACRCQSDLQNSIEEIGEYGRGVLLYVRAPGGDRGRLRHLEPAISAPLGNLDQQEVIAAVNGVALSMLREMGVSADRLGAASPSSERIA